MVIIYLNFISKLKKFKKQYLTFSIIQVNNWYVKQNVILGFYYAETSCTSLYC